MQVNSWNMKELKTLCHKCFSVCVRACVCLSPAAVLTECWLTNNFKEAVFRACNDLMSLSWSLLLLRLAQSKGVANCTCTVKYSRERKINKYFTPQEKPPLSILKIPSGSDPTGSTSLLLNICCSVSQLCILCGFFRVLIECSSQQRGKDADWLCSRR